MACSDGKLGGVSEESEGIVPVQNWKVAGVSQKGPFVTGSVVTVQELDGITLNQTGKSFRGSIKSDKGDFSINGINLVSQYAMLEATGYFWSEISGSKSSGPVSLRAITDLSDRNTVNINLFTHLEYERVMNLVLEKGKTVAEAKAQAESEILAAFGIDVQFANPEDLNIFTAGDGNAALLAVSVLMQGGVDVAGLSERMGAFSMSLAAEGVWDDAKTKAAMADWAAEADNSGLLVDIMQELSEWNEGEVPDFITHVRNFWYDAYGLTACTESREGEIAVDSNEFSERYYGKSGARYVCESGAWIKASNLQSDTKNFSAGDEGEFRAGQVDSLNKYVYDGGKWREATEMERELGAGCTAAMPLTIVGGYVCKEGDWDVARTFDYDVVGKTCVEGDTIIGAKSRLEYVCTNSKFIGLKSMQTWFGADGSDSIYHAFSENPSAWYVVKDGDYDRGTSFISWHATVDTSDANWLNDVIDTCKGFCGDVTFGDGVEYPYVEIGFSLVWDPSGITLADGFDVSNFGGVCVAYSSTVKMSVLIVAPITVVPDYAYAQYELPLSDTVRVERIPWASFTVPSWSKSYASYEASVQKTSELRLELSGDAGTTGSFNIKAFGPYNGSCDKYAELE
ncbi:MAG: hypothetical protein IK012_01015 [Fibrobacter sp.]|uniref:hypothetical protein n=1 Tax=Fibrobacter sp. TaxID=35828 RepID=UPI0025BC16AE|nr:hypothetical protein [Fibrobacter sp.]MBR4783823.1 hypothetical protein [Fibrobacter sp.]